MEPAGGGFHNPLLYPLRPMSETPDWSQVATKQDLTEATQELKQEFKRLKWTLLIGFTTVLILPDGSMGLALVTVLARFF